MSRGAWYFLDKESGRFLGNTYRGPLDGLKLNTPRGMRAVEGEPPAELLEELEVLRLEQDAERLYRRDVLQQILDLENSQGRALREVALEQPGALERLDKIDQQIAALRAEL